MQCFQKTVLPSWISLLQTELFSSLCNASDFILYFKQILYTTLLFLFLFIDTFCTDVPFISTLSRYLQQMVYNTGNFATTSNGKKYVNSFLPPKMFLLFLILHGATSHMRAGSGTMKSFPNNQLWTCVHSAWHLNLIDNGCYMLIA